MHVTPLVRLVPTFRPVLGLVLFGTVGLMLASATGIVGPLLVAHAIDVDVALGDRQGLMLRALLYGCTIALGFVATLVARIALEIAAQRAMLALKQRLFHHLVDHDLALHDRLVSGSLIGRVQGDVEALRVLFVEVILALPADIVLAVGMLVVLLQRAPSMALPLLVVAPVHLALFVAFRIVAPSFFVRQRAAVSHMTATLAETFRSLPALRALGRHEWATERAVGLVDAAGDADVRSAFQPIWYFNSVRGLQGFATLGLLIWGSMLVADGRATIGALVVGMAYLRQLFQPLMRLSNHLATLERARASAGRLVELLDTPKLVTSPQAPVGWPGLGEALALHDVDFHYHEDSPVLRGVSLTIAAGSRVALVGATGSGKSTVVDLVLRLRDPISGAVTLDGVDLRQLSLETLRQRTALVLQDVQLLPGTVLDNLVCDEARAREAFAALGVTLALDRQVDDRSLSKGERQLVTFARALVRDPEILVLDEATSAVDPATQHIVERALDRLMAGRTVLIVAHRLETVVRCDRIYVMDEGRVVEQGTHQELVAIDGVYAELVRVGLAA